MPNGNHRILVQTGDFDISAEIARLTHEEIDVGAVVAFTGVCRGEGGRLVAIELEHYPGMAEGEIGRIAAEASRRWPLAGLTIIHRFGRIIPGENIVLVATASPHRQAAFAAAEFLMDFMKTRAPSGRRIFRPPITLRPGWRRASKTRCRSGAGRRVAKNDRTLARANHDNRKQAREVQRAVLGFVDKGYPQFD